MHQASQNSATVTAAQGMLQVHQLLQHAVYMTTSDIGLALMRLSITDRGLMETIGLCRLFLSNARDMSSRWQLQQQRAVGPLYARVGGSTKGGAGPITHVGGASSSTAAVKRKPAWRCSGPVRLTSTLYNPLRACVAQPSPLPLELAFRAASAGSACDSQQVCQHSDCRL